MIKKYINKQYPSCPFCNEIMEYAYTSTRCCNNHDVLVIIKNFLGKEISFCKDGFKIKLRSEGLIFIKYTARSISCSSALYKDGYNYSEFSTNQDILLETSDIGIDFSEINPDNIDIVFNRLKKLVIFS